MTREIRLASKRKVDVEEIGKKYHAIQSWDRYNSCWKTTREFKTEEEAREEMEKMAREYLGKSQRLDRHRIVYIEEIAEYEEKRQARW